MKPAELQPLKGKRVELYWQGRRTGKITGIPKSDHVRVKLLDPYGSRTVHLSEIIGVLRYGRIVPVSDFLSKVTKK